MRRVIIESPYAGDVTANMEYLQRALRDSISRGEAPFASHQMYTMALRDTIPSERKLGIRAGLAWLRYSDVVVVYMDRGISDGMKIAIAHAELLGIPVEYRSIA